MRSSKMKRAPLTRAEIQAAYRRRQAVERRTELRELVCLAFELGQRAAGRKVTVSPSMLLSEVRAVRDMRASSGKSKAAARYLATLGAAGLTHAEQLAEAQLRG